MPTERLFGGEYADHGGTGLFVAQGAIDFTVDAPSTICRTLCGRHARRSAPVDGEVVVSKAIGANQITGMAFGGAIDCDPARRKKQRAAHPAFAVLLL